MQQTAVVIGSGMGGLAVAQVLSKHCGSVTVVEKDQPKSLMEITCVEAWQEGGKVRPGVLQVSTATAVATQVSSAGQEWACMTLPPFCDVCSTTRFTCCTQRWVGMKPGGCV